MHKTWPGIREKNQKQGKKGRKVVWQLTNQDFVLKKSRETRPLFFSRILCKKPSRTCLYATPRNPSQKWEKLHYPPDIGKNYLVTFSYFIYLWTREWHPFFIDIIHMNINIFNHITKYKTFTIRLPTITL